MLDSLKQVQDALRIYGPKAQNRRAEDVKKSRPALGTDTVSLSAESKELQAIQQAVAQAPDVREITVAELREAIKSGLYTVSGEEIAEKMLAHEAVKKSF